MTLTRDAIRELAAFRSGEAPVVSLYLDVDGRRFPRPRDYELQLERLLRGSHPAAASEDVRLIESFVKAGLDRSETRSLVIFSSAATGLWRVIELPVPVHNQLTVNQVPQVRQLEAVLDEYERFGVLLVDRQRTRVFVFELGKLVEKSELLDELPRHEDDGGEFERDHVRDHKAAHVHQHLRRAAQLAFRIHQDRPLDHLIISAPEEIRGDLERELHPYLRDRIAARLSLPVVAKDDDIRQAALSLEEQLRRQRHDKLVSRLRDAVGAGAPGWVASKSNSRSGASGLEPVLATLAQRRVETLLVSEGYEAPGWECSSCGTLATKGPTCPTCGASMGHVDDVVETAVDQAVLQSCRVAICADNADLDVLGRIGALLRF